ncbi:conjugal transfer protein TraD [Chryseobacterium sp. ISL-6]|uniref:conjugal transfer protein TraD n=1 Tax=Chryseobacterium sp. ISL-6 TaxID=2819143 RepID=UPI001BE879B2|nr:conjugal transfer protein TraD [Chryseobacterium sp. ISL-6]MBT2623734.1 conjugal transfer protein TraD [Chryseobacterium sp. ISL-6]
MDILILMGLIIIIILLARDKMIINKVIKEKKSIPNHFVATGIMGKTKQPERHLMPANVKKHQFAERIDVDDNFETETKEKNLLKEILKEELDEVFGYELNLEEEEEEFINQRFPNGDNGFALGVTFDELSTVGALLQQEHLEPALQRKAVDIVQKIQGTELFSLMESSIKGASHKIAELLDKSLSTEKDSGSSYFKENDVSDFDIGKFV